MIAIRDAHVDDAPAIAAADAAEWSTRYRGVFPDAYLDGDEIERSRREGWPRRLALGGRRPGRGEVYGFYLHPDAWGIAAATELMRVCERELASTFTTAVLWTLFDTPRSRRFYEKAGWTCGTGDEVVTTTWDLTGDPVTVVQYRRDLP